MATPKQLTALEKWLKTPLKEMEFETADNALTRLHAASELYNKNPAKEKGIVKKTKEAILVEFKAKGLINETDEEEREDKQLETFANGLDIQKKKEKEKESIDRMIGPGDINHDEEGSGIEKEEEEIIQDTARKLKACMPYAGQIVETEFSIYGLGDDQKAELKEKIGVSMYIQAARRGL